MTMMNARINNFIIKFPLLNKSKIARNKNYNPKLNQNKKETSMLPILTYPKAISKINNKYASKLNMPSHCNRTK